MSKGRLERRLNLEAAAAVNFKLPAPAIRGTSCYVSTGAPATLYELFRRAAAVPRPNNTTQSPFPRRFSPNVLIVGDSFRWESFGVSSASNAPSPR